MKKKSTNLAVLFYFLLLSNISQLSAQTVSYTVDYSGYTNQCCTANSTSYFCFNSPSSSGYCGTPTMCNTTAFTDPVPAGNIVTGITVNYYSAGCGGGILAGTVNGTVALTSVTEANTGCSCVNGVSAFGIYGVATTSFPCGLPGYNNGGTNSFQFCASTGQVCIDKAVLIFTYKPTSMAVPAFAPTIVNGPTPICPGASVTYSCPAVANAIDYAWTVPAGWTITSGGTTNVITVTAGSSSGNVCVRAQNLCGNSAYVCKSVIVNVPSVAPTGATANPNPVCGTNSSTLTVSGGSLGTGAAWNWHTGSCAGPVVGTGSSITVAPGVATTYFVNAIGTCNTTSCASVLLSINPIPTIGLGSVSSATICNGQSTTITPSGASSYTIMPGGTVGTSFVVSPTSTTNYTINGTSSSGCISSTSTDLNTTIVVNPIPTIGLGSISSATICSGQSTIITPSGALSYTITPGGTTGTSFNVSPTTTTTYTINGTNSFGCISSAVTDLNPTVVVNPTPTIGLGSISAATICAGQSATITPSGASSYTILPGGTTGSSFVVSPTSTTTYTINGTNSVSGCISSSSTDLNQTIVVNPTPTLGLGSVSASTICAGQNTIITPSGATTYTLIPGGITGTSFTVSPTTTTNYTINGTNGASGCSSSSVTDLNTTIVVNPTPTVGLGSVSSSTICNGQSAIITPSGASIYTISPGGTTGSSFTVSPTTTTTYTINGTNGATGCISSSVTDLNPTIVVNPTPTISLTSLITATICSGESTVLTPSGATSYTLLPDGTIGTSFAVSPSTTTTYTINGTNSVSGCVSSSVTDVNPTVFVNPTPTVGLGSVSSSTICEGQSTVITPSGASSYSITPGGTTGTSFTVSPTSTTTYTIIGTSSLGCVSSTTANLNTTIVVNPSPTVSLGSVSSNTICEGQSAVITPTGLVTYTLFPGGSTGASFTVSPTSTTTYTIIGTDLLGCTSLSSTDLTSLITVNTTPTITLVSFGTNTICNGQSVILTPSGATNYTILPDGTVSSSGFTVSPATTATYTIIGVNSFGCVSNSTNNLTSTVVVNPTPTIALSSTIAIPCGFTITTISPTVTPSTGVTYQWFGGTGTNTLSTLDVTAIGDYSVVVTNTTTGCFSTASITVVQGNVVAGFLADPTTGFAPITVSFTNTSTGALTYNWDFGNGTTSTLQDPTSLYGTGGTFTVTLIASAGPCSDTAYTVIVLQDSLNLIIPNVFTPNGDGTNDFFTIRSAGVKEISLQIFNRWGEKMYEFTGPKASWDGVGSNGTKVADGTYFYFVKAYGYDTKEIEQHGTVNLFR